MTFYDYLFELIKEPTLPIHAEYSAIFNYPEDIGFFSTFEHGHDFHHLTQEIVVSIQEMKDCHQRALIFVRDKRYRLELEDTNIADYFCDYIELRYVLKGHLVVAIGQERAVFEAGEICFMNSRAYHHEILDESDCIVLNVNMSGRIFNDLFLNQIGIPRLQQFVRDHLVRRSVEERYLSFAPKEEDSLRFIEDSFQAIIQEARNYRIGQMYFYQGHILQLLDHLAVRYSVIRDKHDVQIYHDLLIESIANYVQDHLQTVTLNDLAKEYHYHPNFFTSLIKRYYGVNFSDYLMHQRIFKAKKLLKDTTLNIDEIIYLVGYSNKSFFTRKFREQVGLSPSQFRKDSRPSAHQTST